MTPTNFTKTRGAVYVAMLAASALSLYGLADFDVVSGAFDLRPFNLYAVGGAVAGVVSSGLASVALLFGWGKK